MKNKSIDFLLKNAGPVIQYRLRKEIIGKISEEDKRFLDEIYEQPHNKRYAPLKIEYPTPYVDVKLEQDYKKESALDCDLTFWAVQLRALAEKGERDENRED